MQAHRCWALKKKSVLFGERGIDERGAQVLISDSGLRGWYCISSGLVLRRAFADAHVLPPQMDPNNKAYFIMLDTTSKIQTLKLLYLKFIYFQ